MERRHLNTELTITFSILGVALFCICVSTVIILCHLLRKHKVAATAKKRIEYKKNRTDSQIKLETNRNLVDIEQSSNKSESKRLEFSSICQDRFENKVREFSSITSQMPRASVKVPDQKEEVEIKKEDKM
ncbi:unnamed protein product [Moneuplotes crassus]|uniref:Uncharacterized protein n=1 Tax=Euplotes crassus TaxID=5936 RepID=A0AAD1XME4_EUPCR|nr:unnamed protein product [Moneuplotes crassus]